MSCCDDLIKYLLFIFNLIFSLTGLALIIVGAYLLTTTSSFSGLISDVGSGLKTPQIFIIVVGVAIFFIASLGCWGAIRENRCMLITFGILLLTIFIIQLAIGIFALTNQTDFKQKVEQGLATEFTKSKTDSNVKKLFETMERDLECCGVRGFADYLGDLRVVPGSCCEDKSDCRIKPLIYWKQGCANALTNFSGKAGEILGGVAIALSIVELLSAIFALRLASKIR